MTDIINNTLIMDNKQRHNESVKRYLKKRYCQDIEYRNKKATEMRQKYKRITTNCNNCNLRIKTELLINGLCYICNNK